MASLDRRDSGAESQNHGSGQPNTVLEPRIHSDVTTYTYFFEADNRTTAKTAGTALLGDELRIRIPAAF